MFLQSEEPGQVLSRDSEPRSERDSVVIEGPATPKNPVQDCTF